MSAQRYRSRPSVIRAVRWDGTNYDELEEFAPGKVRKHVLDETNWYLELLAGKDGEQGWVPVAMSNLIVRAEGDDSDYWPVTSSYFEAKYEEWPEWARPEEVDR